MVKRSRADKEIARLRSEVRKIDKKVDATKGELLNTRKDINPFTGLVSGNLR